MSTKSEMTHRAFSVIKREGQEDYWLPVGAAFEHADECIRFLPWLTASATRRPLRFERHPDGSFLVRAPDRAASASRRLTPYCAAISATVSWRAMDRADAGRSERKE
jgi:hypothetical protein